MKNANMGLCNDCRTQVPAEFFFPNGEVWIRKECPKCGKSEWPVSTDAVAWQAKKRSKRSFLGFRHSGRRPRWGMPRR